jgi:HSP20 family protein
MNMACCAVERTEKKEQRTATVRPRVDILETASEFLLVADMPGVSPTNVDLSFDKGELTLRGSRSGPRAVQFERTFAVSDVVAADRIGAEIKDGVLTVTLPKTEAVKPRKIAVHAN